MSKIIDLEKFMEKYKKLYEANKEFLKKSRVPEKTEGYLHCQEDTMRLLNSEQIIEIPRWIPWGVKYPQVDQYILVTLNKDMLRGDDINHPVVILRYSDGKDDWIHTVPNVVTAWMPLPEPYKKEGEAE